MQRLPKNLTNTLLTNALVTYYTVPTNTITTISACTFTNITAGAVTAKITIGALVYLSDRVISAGESYIFGGVIGHSMAAGTVVQASAGALTSINLLLSGYETNP